MTPDVHNNIARTRLLSLLQLTNSQSLAFVNLVIILSTEVQGIRVFSKLAERELNEKTYRRHFTAEFEFTQFNVELVHLRSALEAALLLVMDGSFIAKSGKATPGINWYWNGSASRVEKGFPDDIKFR